MFFFCCGESAQKPRFCLRRRLLGKAEKPLRVNHRAGECGSQVSVGHIGPLGAVILGSPSDF